MCSIRWCLVSGDWHIAWEVPLNDLWAPIRHLTGWAVEFPAYMFSVFILPLFYGMWRFVIFQFFAGPFISSYLTSNPNEIPAIWCLFSIGLLMIGMSPVLRGFVGGKSTVNA